MKKLLSLILLISFTGIASFAQHFGVQAGGLISNMKVKSDLYTVNSRIKPGFIIGGVVEFPFNETMAITGSLNYKTMGTWIKSGDDKSGTSLGYIDLDVCYEYIFALGDIEIFGIGGMYTAYAVTGKWITKIDGDKNTGDLDIGSDDTDHIRGFDVGLIIGGGVYLGKMKFTMSFQQGLANLSNDDDEKVRNVAGVLTFAYFFNRN